MVNKDVAEYELAYGMKAIPFNYGFGGASIFKAELPIDLSKFLLKLRCNVVFRPLSLLASGTREFVYPLCAAQVSYWNLSNHAIEAHHSHGELLKEKLISLKKFFARCNSIYA